MKLVVGLGNIGKEFAQTRHNIGFMVAGQLAKTNLADWQPQPKLFAETAQYSVGGEKVILAKPDTLMNRSGKAVQAVAHYYKIDLEDIIVISDDLDLSLGKIRVRTGGSSGGQNGLKSIIELVGEEFVRVRVGIAGEERGRIDASDYVLQKFTPAEVKHLASIVQNAANITTTIITEGAEHVSHNVLG